MRKLQAGCGVSPTGLMHGLVGHVRAHAEVERLVEERVHVPPTPDDER